MTVVEEAGAWGMPVESEGDEEEGKQGGEDAGEPGQDGQSRTVADGRARRQRRARRRGDDVTSRSGPLERPATILIPNIRRCGGRASEP